MSITGWLSALSCSSASCTERDLDHFNGHEYPFLGAADVEQQITCLSKHLAPLRHARRQSVIAYSLYARQMDVIQQDMTKAYCAHECARPPVGCCNRHHCDVYSLSDILISRPTSGAMELAHSIRTMQDDEHAYREAALNNAPTTLCRYFMASGCTLKLFKSPLCIHYLCDGIIEHLKKSIGTSIAPFIDAMHCVATRQLLSCTDFTSADTITTAMAAIPHAITCPAPHTAQTT